MLIKLSLDTDMRSPSPEPAHGSSRSSGGTLRGHHDTHRFADMQEDDDVLPGVTAQGRVLIYTTSKDPGVYDPEAEKPSAVVDIPCLLSFGSVLTTVKAKYPKISSECYYFHCWLSIEVFSFLSQSLSSWFSHNPVCMG